MYKNAGWGRSEFILCVKTYQGAQHEELSQESMAIVLLLYGIQVLLVGY
jgi:hypothetical protein